MISLVEEDIQSQLDDIIARRTSLMQSTSYDQFGLDWCHEHTQLVDHLIQLLYAKLRRALPQTPKIAVIAVGGYGRSELAPYSDIDLTVVPLEEDSPYLDEALRSLFRALHQSLGGPLRYELGYAYRLIADTPGLDPTTRTGLLDARLVAGSNTVFTALMDAFWRDLPTGEFVLAKISERKLAETRTNDTPLVVEPHLKEGAGGLRSFQCANWVRSAIGERPLRGGHAYETLIRIRNLLHIEAGRKNDLLTRQRAGEIAERWNLDQDLLQQELLGALLEGNEQFSLINEKLLESRFSLSTSVETIRGEARILPDSDPGDAAVGIAIATQLGIAVTNFPARFSSSVNGPAAMFGISQGEMTIRNFDRCGILDGLLPELTACRTLLPGDSSHVYSVFEHTLRVVRQLDQASSLPFFGELYEGVARRAALYLAALLHDVGKLQSMKTGVGHSEEGAKIAEAVCNRLGLDESASHIVVWLVREHLTMSLFLRLRDIENPSTIIEFAGIVQNQEKLHMLALLTWADICAVGPGSFTPGQEASLKELVSRTYEALEGDSPALPDNPLARKSLIQRIAKSNRDPDEIESLLQILPAQYLTGTASTDVQKHVAMFRQATEESASLDFVHMPEINSTEVTIACQDRPGLLSEILGVFYAFDLNIDSIKAFTTQSTPPIALDIFAISFGAKPVPTGTLRQVSICLKNVLDQKDKVDEILMKRDKDPHRRQNVLRFKFLPGPPAILECHCPRGKGMPFRLSRLLSDRGVNIVGARVGQWAGTAAAAFYLESNQESANIESAITELFSKPNET